MTIRTIGIGAAAWLLAAGLAAAASAPDSKRMERAKDFIADEQWGRAIAELQAAAGDPKEANRDEALFWLAHSQHQAGDYASALQMIANLERTMPRSKWVMPARSLRIEIAQRLRRDDVLLDWLTPPPPPPAPSAVPPRLLPTPRMPQPVPPAPAPGAAPPTPPPGPPRAVPAPVAPPAPRGIRTGTPMAVPFPVTDGTEVWPTLSREPFERLQAMTGLLDTHGPQVIPLLREIALDRSSPDEARMAVFVLGQSRRPEAERTMVEVAHVGAEPVRVAAVRELGRFNGPTVTTELMRVYTMANTPPRLKQQVVSSFGDRADSASLWTIVNSESEPAVRDFAIVTLGRTGAREQLRTLYVKGPRMSRAVVLNALFSAKDDDELIRIARTEKDPTLRFRARQQLRMLATPKAVKFLEENP